jgi:RHS repeat-associated protein
MGRPIIHAAPESGRSLRLFNANGSEVLSRNAIGQEVRRTYDALRRPLAVSYSGAAAPDVRYEYVDSASPAPSDGVRFRIGRAWKVIDAIGELSVAYDAFGRSISSTRRGTPVAGTFTTDVDYDLLGRITRITLPDLGDGAPREQVSYVYDIAGRPQSATGVVDHARYDAWGRITQLQYANGTITANEFDDLAGRLVRQRVTAPDGTAILDQTAAYDAFGQLASLAAPEGTTTFTYDGLQRLTGVQHPQSLTELFTYSPGGNMTTGTAGAMTYAPASGLLTTAGGAAYAHDAAGRLTDAPYGTLTFDAADHLLTVDLGEHTLEHSYDHADRLAATRRDGALRFLAVSEHLEFRDGKPTLWLSFGGRRIVAARGAARRWLHPDLRGNVSTITGASGDVVFNGVFSAYGMLVAGVAPGGADGRGFLGAAPEESGLICLGLRWYDPRLGRFITPDPLVGGIYLLDAWNPYPYAHNNPIIFTDPSGAWSIWGVIAVALIVTVIVVAAVFTGGAALAGLGILASGLSTSTLVAVGIGAFGGALAGGLSAMKAGGSVWGGALLGGFIGGACALAGGAIGAGILGSMGRTYGAFMLSGAIQGAIGGFGTGFTIGFAGGKGTLNEALLAGARGAIWGALMGAAAGGAARFLIGDGTVHNYLELGTANKFTKNSADLWGGVSAVDSFAGTGEGAAFTTSHAIQGTLSGADAGNISALTCMRDIGPQTFTEIDGAFIAFGKDGALVLVNMETVGTALSTNIALAAQGSVFMDANGFSYARQTGMALKVIPIAGLFFTAVDEFKVEWYTDAKYGFNVFFGSRSPTE